MPASRRLTITTASSWGPFPPSLAASATAARSRRELWRCRLERDGVHWRHHQQRLFSNYGGPAIAVENVTSFSGGIVNASGGVINPLHGGIVVRGISIFSGGIVNSGTILSEDNSGIDVFLVSTFSGAITNSGGISAQFIGIDLFRAIAFGTSMPGGGIVNTGKISAGTGIDIGQMSTFSGGISNSRHDLGEQTQAYSSAIASPPSHRQSHPSLAIASHILRWQRRQ